MIQPTRLGPLCELIGYQLRRTSVILDSDFKKVMAGTGLRHVLIGILSIIKENDTINQTVIAETLGMHSANVVRLITELIEKRWVLRQTSTEDRRSSSFTLTDEGLNALKYGLDISQEQEKRVFSNFNEQEVSTLYALLARIPATEK